MDRLTAHALTDQIIQGVYWENGKGCAVGCTIHGDQHAAYETELGISRILARLEDKLFEGMSNDDARSFPLAFLSAIPVGIDVTPVVWKFLAWLLIDETQGIIRFVQTDAQRTAIEAIARLLIRSLTEPVSAEEFSQAGRTAEAEKASYTAADVADSAAYAAEANADEAAAYAADAVYAAAYEVAESVTPMPSLTARQSCFKVMGTKLCELLSQEGATNGIG